METADAKRSHVRAAPGQQEAAAGTQQQLPSTAVGRHPATDSTCEVDAAAGVQTKSATQCTAGSTADIGEASRWQVLGQHEQHVSERRRVSGEQPNTQGAYPSARNGGDGVRGAEEGAQQGSSVDYESSGAQKNESVAEILDCVNTREWHAVQFKARRVASRWLTGCQVHRLGGV